MVMIFTLVSAAQEWLNVKWDEIKKERDEASTRKQKEDEEEERVSCNMSYTENQKKDLLQCNETLFNLLFYRNVLKALV